MAEFFKFSDGFQWGTATSAYQIEGAVHADGRGESIWDVFSHTPGKIPTGETGDAACDHYHLWEQDIELMQALGYKAYRFSLAWPRILPDGRGKINQAGLDFYDRLIDRLLQAGITPLVTLYHWDLPTALPGGWLNRSVVDAFLEFTVTAARAYGDRIKNWVTINEPYCASMLSYSLGVHAPGLTDTTKALTAAHHLLLAHGRAVPVLRAHCPDAQVGIALNLGPFHPLSDSEADRNVARFSDGELNRWFLDPLYGRGYPADIIEDYNHMGVLQSEEPDYIQAGDFDHIAVPTDFLGINYYTRTVVGAVPGRLKNLHYIHRLPAPMDNQTEMGWEIYPQGLTEILERVHRDYNPASILIAENGASYPNGPEIDGKIHDDKRIAYLQSHIQAVARAIQAGVPVDGYYVWSFMDNYEWRFGYGQRFGLVHVNFQDQKRIAKDSAYWYGQIASSNAIVME